MTRRCAWAKTELSIAYHDREWGVPSRDDRLLFEFLILEGAQAGLSWESILRKRENYRKAFDNFEPAKVAKYDQRKADQLLQNEGIIRNRLKINAAIQHAKAFLKVQQEFGSVNPEAKEGAYRFLRAHRRRRPRSLAPCFTSVSKLDHRVARKR
jgi:DNA-3-methyladenine glycosylase I